MIDPLRPYWPTNRSIAGLLIRGLLLLVATAAVSFRELRHIAFLVVLGTAAAHTALLVFEWMELKHARRSGIVAAAIVAMLGLSLVAALLIESRSVLVLSVR